MLWLLYTCIVGLAAGWIVSKLLGLNTNDWTKNLLIGVIGSFVGSLLAALIGLRSTNLFGSIILAVIGAFVALLLYNKFFRK